MRVKSTHKKNGYLLLEATIALIISAVILTAVLQTMNWNLKVSNTAIENSNGQMKEAAFFSFLDRSFSEIAGDANVSLSFVDTPRHIISELTIQNSSEPFIWAGAPFSVKAIKIVTRPNSSNNLDIVLEYYTDYLISSPHDRGAIVLPDQEPVQTLTLLENILRFEWRVWDGLQLDQDGNPTWGYEWNRGNALPRYFELNAIFEQDRSPVIHTFWNPKKVNPSAHFQVQQTRINQQNEDQP